MTALGGYENLDEVKIQSKMEDLLKECIEHHCKLLNCVRAFEKHWNAYFSVTISVCLAQSVLLLTSSAMKVGNSSVLVYLGLIVGFYTTLGICCYLSQQVTTECAPFQTELLKEAIYGCGWIDSSKSFKRSLGIMVSMTNQPIVIQAAGFIPLSMDTFKSVLNSAYSTYMVLRSF